MAFTTAQQDQMDKILIKEPDIAVNRLKNIIGSTNWTAVKNYIGVFKREAETEARHDIIDAFPITLVEPVDANLQALDTLVETASQSVTEAREHLENCNYFLASVVELRKRYEEGQITVK